MKRCTAIITIAMATLTSIATAVELEPFIKLGTFDTTENNHDTATAHKVMLGAGLNIHFDADEKAFKKIIGFEYDTMSEPKDEDIEMISDIMSLVGKLTYDIKLTDETTLYPIGGLKLQSWRRNSPKDQKQFWGDLLFAEGIAGIGLKQEKFFAELEANLPFWSTTDSGHEPTGNLGLNARFGITPNKRLSFGLYYASNSFDGDGSQGDFGLEQYGLFVAYKFPHN